MYGAGRGRCTVMLPQQSARGSLRSCDLSIVWAFHCPDNFSPIQADRLCMELMSNLKMHTPLLGSQIPQSFGAFWAVWRMEFTAPNLLGHIPESPTTFRKYRFLFSSITGKAFQSSSETYWCGEYLLVSHLLRMLSSRYFLFEYARLSPHHSVASIYTLPYTPHMTLPKHRLNSIFLTNPPQLSGLAPAGLHHQNISILYHIGLTLAVLLALGLESSFV